MARDLYEILGVKRNASEKDLRQAYRRLARKYHPDVNPGDKAAEERFKSINRAYEVLSDSEKRSKYDRYGEHWEQAEAFEKARSQAGGGPGYQTFHFDMGDLFGSGRPGGGQGGGFESIFDTLFRGAGSTRGPVRGQNVEYSTEITLEEAYHGATRVLQLQSEEPCPACGGSGRIANAICHVCQGEGATLKPRRLEVKIPAGAREGTRVRVAGEGVPGMAGGPRGDLYVAVHVRAHSRFERKGDDLWTDIGVPVEDAVLGGEAHVQTLAGKRIAVTIPPLTQNGRSIRLAGLGMPKLEGRGKGDLYLRVRVALPEKLSDREKALFEELRDLRKPSGVKE